MTNDEISIAVMKRIEQIPFKQITKAGIAFGVSSSDPELINWMLKPIDEESHERYVDALVGMYKKMPMDRTNDI